MLLILTPVFVICCTIPATTRLERRRPVRKWSTADVAYAVTRLQREPSLYCDAILSRKIDGRMVAASNNATFWADLGVAAPHPKRVARYFTMKLDRDRAQAESRGRND